MGYAPRSGLLDTGEAIAARGGGLYPFFLRPAKEKGDGDEKDRPAVGFVRLSYERLRRPEGRVGRTLKPKQITRTTFLMGVGGTAALAAFGGRGAAQAGRPNGRWGGGGGPP